MTSYTYFKLMAWVPKSELDNLWEKESFEEKKTSQETDIFIHKLMDKISELTPSADKSKVVDNIDITGFEKRLLKYQDPAYWEKSK